MKRITALLLAVLLLASLCACGKSSNGPSGTYTGDLAGLSYTYIFNGNKVTKEGPLGSKNGTFTMDNNTVNITFEDGNKDSFTYDKKTDTLDFAGVMKLTKK